MCCFGAAMNGKLDTLKWLREAGCPWRAEECASIALKNERFDVLDWMRSLFDLEEISFWKRIEVSLAQAAGLHALSTLSLDWLNKNQLLSPVIGAGLAEGVKAILEELEEESEDEDDEEEDEEQKEERKEKAEQVLNWLKCNKYI